MSLRKRVSFVSAAAVAIAIFLAAGVCYFVVRDQLLGQVDTALHDQAELVLASGNFGLGAPFPGLPPNAGGRAPYSQLVGVDGAVLKNNGGLILPVNSATRQVAVSPSASVLETVYVGNSHLRIFTFHDAVADGTIPVAVELARPLGPVDNVLSKLRLILLLLCAGGIALAWMLGRVAARRVLAPLAEVTQAAEIIGKTDDLSRRIGVHADDEVGQLATRFNAMLERLEGSRAELDESVRAQRQLVADASHELRTPVTSLRTNIEVLLAGADLDDEERGRLLTDVVEQSEELSSLVGDLIDLARGDLPADAAEDTRLDRIVGESVSRSRRNSPNITFEARLEPVIVDGIPERLGRAVNNLLDNAARHSPRGGTVEVQVDHRGVAVRDHGEGIPEQDLPHVFDRFFRGANTRGKQGSGLGLAIVRQVAEQHGGSVSAANAPDGGAIFTLSLPTSPAAPGHEHGEQPAGAESPEPVRAQ
jgi:two-component system, OmpR family, sensor histidine kinase MprB